MKPREIETTSTPLFTTMDPSLSKWVNWTLLFLAARTPKPFYWSSFLALNPWLKKRLLRLAPHQNETNRRRLAKTANLISCVFLYLASSGTKVFPKDYVLLYLWFLYYGEFNPPSALKILVSPRLSPYLKINNYKNRWVSRVYENKEYIFYPAIFGQILSNYLTPTQYKLNQRYLSSSIKTRILNPIWINYSLGYKSHYMNWRGLLSSYVVHNLAFGGAMLLVKYKRLAPSVPAIKSYLLHVVHTANSFTNFIYMPNLISILLISLTSPLLSWKRPPSHHTKIIFKTYIKVIGFIAGFATLYCNSLNLIPDYGLDEPADVRQIPKHYLNALNLYLFRLILLSKWRITKENHPTFRKLRVSSWATIEAVVMCIGVYKVMNLTDYVYNEHNELVEECQELKQKPLIKGIRRITN